MPDPSTSEDNPIRLAFITPRGDAGWVAITLAPGKKTQGSRGRWNRDLALDLDHLRALGATTLVPLVTDDELRQLRIPRLVEEARARGLDVVRFPFHDGGIPRDIETTRGFVRGLKTRLEGGERLVIHCNGGLGRAGTIGACLRLELGLDDAAAAAIAAIRKARDRRAVETPEQERFVAAYAETAPTRPAAPTDTLGSAHEPTPAHSAVGDRFRGAFLGLVVGDALGAPVEFQSAEEIRRRHGVVQDMMAGGPWLAGEWTDDTALTLATAQAYAGGGDADVDAAAQAMVAWLASGPKDVGGLTHAVLAAIRDGKSEPAEAGAFVLASRPGAAGNGSLMRALATGLVRTVDDPRLVSESIALSRITHADPRCTAACVAFNAAISALVREASTVTDALAIARRRSAGLDAQVTQILDDVSARRPLRHDGASIGYVLLCLERSLVALRDATTFEQGLVSVVNQGGDADTNGAVAGALLGARFGLGAIPARWVDHLLRRHEVDAALQTLLTFTI